jgi:hypothetical protein
MTEILEKITSQLQAQIASALAGVGLVWATEVATRSRIGMRALVNTPGVVELLGVSVLVWLIAKWRSVAAKRVPVDS